MFSIPDPDPAKPLKCNILWYFRAGYVLDIDGFYNNLKRTREIPSGKNKYSGIERAVKQLVREGWPVSRIMDHNGIAWYFAGDGFEKYYAEGMLRIVKKEVGSMKRKIGMREIGYRLIPADPLPLNPSEIPPGAVLLKLFPDLLK